MIAQMTTDDFVVALSKNPASALVTAISFDSMAVERCNFHRANRPTPDADLGAQHQHISSLARIMHAWRHSAFSRTHTSMLTAADSVTSFTGFTCKFFPIDENATAHGVVLGPK